MLLCLEKSYFKKAALSLRCLKNLNSTYIVDVVVVVVLVVVIVVVVDSVVVVVVAVDNCCGLEVTIGR